LELKSDVGSLFFSTPAVCTHIHQTCMLAAYYSATRACNNPTGQYGPANLLNANIIPDKDSYLNGEQALVRCNNGFMMNPKLRVNWGPTELDQRVKHIITCAQRNAWSPGEWVGLTTYSLCIAKGMYFYFFR